jgi:hypothetical protein
MKPKKKLVIAIDFDGTIVKDRWPEIGPFRFGAKWCLKWLKKRGHVLILNTCREDKLLHNAWLKVWSWFNYYNQNDPKRSQQYGSDCRKISADWYIDDRAGFLGWWSIPFIIWWLERSRQ